jgi:hypothetical protein
MLAVVGVVDDGCFVCGNCCALPPPLPLLLAGSKTASTTLAH